MQKQRGCWSCREDVGVVERVLELESAELSVRSRTTLLWGVRSSGHSPGVRTMYPRGAHVGLEGKLTGSTQGNMPHPRGDL